MNIEEQNKRFFGRLACIYDYIFGNWILGIQRKVIRFSKIPYRAKVLDVGCGTGNFLSLLEKKGAKTYGIDISKEMLAVAKGKLRRTRLKLSSAENIKFRKNLFDYVFSVDAFHHFSDKGQAMDNFYRILKKNGKIVIVDVNFGRFLNKVFQKIEPGNNGIYDGREMKRIFKQHNFRDIKQKKVCMTTIMTIGIK